MIKGVPNHMKISKYKCVFIIIGVIMLTLVPVWMLVQCSNCYGSFSPYSHEKTISTIAECDKTLDIPPYVPPARANRPWNKDDYLITSSFSGMILNQFFDIQILPSGGDIQLFHVVVTRWALSQGNLEVLNKARLLLFKHFSLSTLSKQTSSSFLWFLFSLFQNKYPSLMVG